MHGIMISMTDFGAGVIVGLMILATIALLWHFKVRKR